MSNRVRHVVALQLALLILPAALSAQAGTHFEALSMPPQDVGSCVPLPRATPDTSAIRSHHRLVMKSIPPGRHREMTALVDRQGRGAGYIEMSFVKTGTLATSSTHIFATFRDDQMVFGSRTDGNNTFPDSVLSDPYGFLNGRYQQTITSNRKPLEDSEQRTIRELIAFLRKRCPA